MAGVECEFVEKPPKAFQYECPICLLVLREPYQATCCGKSFCKKCIDRVKGNNQDCPTCNERNFNLFHNKGLEQSLHDFEVYCSHKSKGCEWRGELRELDKHLNSEPATDKSFEGCLFTVISCPLGCAGCERGVCRKDIKSHVNDRLLGHVMAQTTKIKSLEQQLQEVQLAGAHLAKQLQTQAVSFKQQLEEVTIVNAQLVSQLHTCQQRVTELELKNGNLESEVTLKQTQSQSQLDQPTPKPTSAALCQSADNSKPLSPIQKQPTVRLRGTFKPSGGEFTMANFDRHVRNNETWFSPPFYTHPNGYKMCLQVDANGRGDKKGIFMSLYVYLMRGEFDDQLKWPFYGKVNVRLLNQEEDRDHVVKTIDFNDTASDESICRVIGRERAGRGRGNRKIFPLSELKPRYLKYDCIKLSVNKVVLS